VIDRAIVEHVRNEELLLQSLAPREQRAHDDLLRTFLAGLE
jgi:hypothetical protein